MVCLEESRLKKKCFHVFCLFVRFCQLGCYIFAPYKSWYLQDPHGWEVYRKNYEAKHQLLVVKGIVHKCSKDLKERCDSEKRFVYTIKWPFFEGESYDSDKKHVAYFDEITAIGGWVGNGDVPEGKVSVSAQEAGFLSFSSTL